MSEEQAALSLVFDGGEVVVLRPTVLGVGGLLVEWVGDGALETVVTIDSYVPAGEATVVWMQSENVETPSSVEARRLYDDLYGQPGIGEDVPARPDKEYETVEYSGSLLIAGLLDAREILLPSVWDLEIEKTSTSGIWLSKEQYQELVSTRATTFSLGLFDQSLADAQAVTSKVGGYMEKISGLIDTIEKTVEEGVMPDTLLPGVMESEDEPVNRIESRSDWGSYDLLIDNGKRLRVRTIEASNAFGSYTILANPDNPLVLEVTLTPLSQGASSLSVSGLAQGFGGYEVYGVYVE